MEILLVDDNSPDGTAFMAREIGRKHCLRVRVLTREEKLSLGSVIGVGIGEATGDLVCVMDADLSHPPSLVTKLLEALGSADGVVASKYIPGGSVVNWPHRRKVISRVATSMARLLFRPPCQDPLSGFFLFRRSSIGNVRITGLGNKPLLEILVQGSFILREVPYTFQNRNAGKSKLDAKEILEYAYALMVLRRRMLAEEGRRGLHGLGHPPSTRGP